jgi:hypothetical protein
MECKGNPDVNFYLPWEDIPMPPVRGVDQECGSRRPTQTAVEFCINSAHNYGMEDAVHGSQEIGDDSEGY